MESKGISRISQVKIYVGKHIRLFVTERGWKVLIFAAIISLLVSSVLGNRMFIETKDTFSGTFTLVSACIWIGVFNSIQTICKERAIIKREHRTGLHITAYVASHLIFQALICLAQAVILLGISAIFLTYPTVPALLGSVYLEYFITYFLTTYAADVLGLAISSIVKTPTTAMTVMPFVLIIQLILSGMLFTLTGPAEMVANGTISKWGLNATCISCDYNNLESSELLRMREQLYSLAQQNHFDLTQEEAQKLVEDNYVVTPNPVYEHDLSNLTSQWLVLVAHIAVYSLVSVLALEMVDKDKR